jgi:hypothetical protein
VPASCGPSDEAWWASLVLGALDNGGSGLASSRSPSPIADDDGSMDVLGVWSRVMGEGGNKVLGCGVDAVDVSLSCTIVDGCAGFAIAAGFGFFEATFLGAMALAHKALPWVD